MLTQFDQRLYPNDCEVVEMPLHNQYIFLIQKNASSSIRKEAIEKNFNFYRNEEIKNLKSIDLYIRDPKQRYQSGVNTYLQHLIRDNPKLDVQTCEWFATNYLYMNRHYLPQFLWIVNLARFLDNDCVLRMKKFEDINKIAVYNSRAGIISANKKFSEKQGLDLYFFADQILRDLSGQDLTWKQLLEHYQNNHNKCWSLMTNTYLEIANVLSKT